MSRLNPRRRAAQARQGQGAQVIGNLSQPAKPRSGKVDAKAPGIAHEYMLANATANAPQGAAFTARHVGLGPKVQRPRFEAGDKSKANNVAYQQELTLEVWRKLHI